MSGKQYIYVLYKDLNQLREYKELNPDYEVVGLTDPFTIRGRCQGQIVYLDGCHEKWDYDGIMESVENAKKEWGVTDEIVLPEEEQDIKYGI